MSYSPIDTSIVSNQKVSFDINKMGIYAIREQEDSGTFLYNKGDECTTLTGGWIANTDLYKSSYTSHGTATKDATQLSLVNTATSPRGTAGYYAKKGFRTTNQIDLTDYTKLVINGDFYESDTRGMFGGGFGIKSDTYDGNNNPPLSSAVATYWIFYTGGASLNLGETYSNQTVEFDISSISGNYYLFFYFAVGDRSGSNGYMKLNTISLR